MLYETHIKFTINNLDIVKQCMYYVIKEHFLFLTPNGNQLLRLPWELVTLKNFHLICFQQNKQLNN